MSSNAERDLLFEELVSRHVDLVFHMARSWCGDPVQAEDLAQLAFIKAYRAFDRFRPGTNFKAWVLRILRNLLADRRRSDALRPELVSLEALPPGEEPEDPPPPPATIDLENKEIFYDLFADELAHLVQKLPKEYQLAVLLCDVEGLTYREVAEVLGCPIGTSRSRIHRGRALLQELLADYAQRLGYLREVRP